MRRATYLFLVFVPLLVLPTYTEANSGKHIEYGLGLISPPFKPYHVNVRVPRKAISYPVRFDWREQGKVTSVKYQGSCGACYAFAYLGEFESKLLIAGEGAFDFSENNLKECEWFNRNGLYPSGCNGGTAWRVVNLLSQAGTVLETCDPFQFSDVTCIDTCQYIKTIYNWRVFSLEEIPPVEVTKYYLMTYGPVFTAIDAGANSSWKHEFENYDGSYTLYYEGPASVNHAVLIVGWDDTLSHAGGQGAWIVKNSWGAGWGGTCGYGSERGYFTIAYGSAKLGYYSAFTTEWHDYDPAKVVLLHDESGYSAYLGYGTTTAWGMNKFVIEKRARLERVELWTTDAVSDLDIYVYDDFDGSNPSNLLTSRTNLSYDEMGYVSVPLPVSLNLKPGDDIYVVVKITNVGFKSPLAFDSKDNSPWSGMSYISYDGASWTLLEEGDLGIRIRVGEDTMPPGKPSSFGAVAGDASVVLSWKNPPDTDFAYTLIRYSTESYPSSPDAGTPVENGNDGIFGGMPLENAAFEHTGLQNGIKYYYSAFAADSSENYSLPAHAIATPTDTLPPLAVAEFEAEGRDEAVMLRWTTPPDSDIAHVLIVYSTSPPPWESGVSHPVENGEDGYFDAQPAMSDSFLHTPLENDTTYYYCIRSADEMLNMSACTYASATPQDTFPPVITVSVLQNPYISNHLDIYFSSSEALLDTSISVNVGGDAKVPTSLDSDRNLYGLDYDIYTSGRLDIEVCARDLVLNRRCVKRSFGVFEVAQSGCFMVSPDGNFEVSIPPRLIETQGYMLIGASNEGRLPGKAYEILPQGLELSRRIRIGIRYESQGADLHHLAIARYENGKVEPLESFVDAEQSKIYAYTTCLGTFGLIRDESISSDEYDDSIIRAISSSPNPFLNSSKISFEVTSIVELDVAIVTIDGRHVVTLYHGEAYPGLYSFDWDGRNEAGRKVASGAYFCRIKGSNVSRDHKIILLR